MKHSPRRKRAKDWLVNVILSVVALFALYSFVDANHQSHVNGGLSTQVLKLTQHSIDASNRHHAETSTQNKLIIKGEQLIAFGEGIISQTQQDHASTLNQVAAVTMEIAALQQEFVSTVQTAATQLGQGQGALLATNSKLQTEVENLSTQVGQLENIVAMEEQAQLTSP